MLSSDDLIQLLRQGNMLIVLVHAPALTSALVAEEQEQEDPADVYQGTSQAWPPLCGRAATATLTWSPHAGPWAQGTSLFC